MSWSDQGTGILCMAYGTPAGEDAVAAYFTHILGGRVPSPQALEHLKRRYRAIGGSPLLRITHAQAAALGSELGLPAFVGMKHAPPFIEEAVADAKILGVKRLIGLPLAPHYARMSFGGYEKALREAWSGPILLISGFHTHPSFIRAVRAVLEEALANFSPQHVFFTAHSLPARIVREGDDYPGRVLESCRLVAEGIELPPWDVAFQSASASGEPWLGPDLLDALETSGARAALICPIGFVADHLEILYDVDVQAASWAWERGIDLRRTRSFNADPVFIAALADVVKDAVAQNALVAP